MEAGANAKAENEAAERARAWAEVEAKDKAEISRVAAEAREKAESGAAKREREWDKDKAK